MELMSEASSARLQPIEFCHDEDMSIIKKIMFKGWNRRDSFPRERIERELEPREPKKLSLKRHTKVCKRNQGLPHEFVLIKETHYEWSQGIWKDLTCKHCGKKTYEFYRLS